MIATALNGGLGNQMFQYAAGRTLALRHRTDLALETSYFSKLRKGSSPRPFELDRMRIQVLASNRLRDVSLLLARRRQRLLRLVGGWNLLSDLSPSYDVRFEKASDGTYLHGFWQSWRYLTEFSAQIATELQPREPLSPRNAALMASMRTTASVSLHVRRGDYLSAAHAYHGVLDLEFYKAAMDHVLGVERCPAVYVFSDDLDWCRQVFSPLGWKPTFVDWNRGDDSWQDLFLISACRHSVVANSSFSWWGAWLGDRAPCGKRIVVAPSRWFAGDPVSAADRCPPEWIIF